MCSALHSLGTRPATWTRVLKRACEAHNIFLPTYPLDNMSVNELQRAALMPYLFKLRLARSTVRGTGDFRNEPPGVNTSGSSKSLDPDRTLGRPLYTEWNEGVGPAFLIPGGRYLISVPRNGDINLYDLELPPSVRSSGPCGGASKAPRRLIAKAVAPEGMGQLSYDFSRLKVIPVSDNGSKVRVTVDCKWNSFRENNLDVV